MSDGLKSKKAKPRATPEQRAEQQRQRRILNEAHRVQREMDKVTLRDKSTEFIKQAFTINGDDIFDDEFFVEYTERWEGPNEVTPTLALKTYTPYFDVGAAKALIQLAEELGMEASFKIDGEKERNICMQVRVNKSKDPSPEAVEQATKTIDTMQSEPVDA